MTCPRCKCDIPNDSTVCEVCGKKLKKKKLFSKKSDKKTSTSKTEIPKETKIKIAIAVSAFAVLIALIIAIVVAIDDNTGVNLADDLKEYLDEPVKTAINESDEYFADESVFDAVNFLTEFDYVIEDDKDVEIDGVNYPRWAIFIVADEEDVIKSVRYVDFRVLKKNEKGIKLDGEVNLNKFKMGEKYRKISKEIDCDVFSITYEGGSVTYDYRYYFINDSKDEQGMSLSVVFDQDGGYIYSTTQRNTQDWIY